MSSDGTAIGQNCNQVCYINTRQKAYKKSVIVVIVSIQRNCSDCNNSLYTGIVKSMKSKGINE